MIFVVARIVSFNDDYVVFRANHGWYPAYMPKNRRGVLSLCEPLVMHYRYVWQHTQELCELFLTHYLQGDVEGVTHGRLFLLPVGYIAELRGLPRPRQHKEVNPFGRRLTWEDVRRMREMHATGRYQHWQLADIFGCSRSNATQILNNVWWRE